MHILPHSYTPDPFALQFRARINNSEGKEKSKCVINKKERQDNCVACSGKIKNPLESEKRTLNTAF